MTWSPRIWLVGLVALVVFAALTVLAVAGMNGVREPAARLYRPAASGGIGFMSLGPAPTGSPVSSTIESTVPVVAASPRHPSPHPSLSSSASGETAAVPPAAAFDDGYSPVALRQILAILKREKIPATFFPYGWAVHQDPTGWHMVVAAGYPIGNHTLTHATLTKLTPEQVTTEMVRGHRTIDLYSGGKSIDLMRPPGGAFNAPTARAIAKAGYDTIVLWDVDTSDWQGPSPATILSRAIKGTNGSIVLMHAGPLNTPKALPGIIANYRAQGFTFVTVPELLAARRG